MARRKHRGDVVRLGIDPLSGITVTLRGVDRGATRDAQARMRPDHLASWLRAGVIEQADFNVAREVETAFGLIANGTRLTLSSAYVGGRVRGTEGPEREWQVRLQQRYRGWAEEMILRHHPLGPILDICVDGLSFGECDRKWQHRNGWAKKGFLLAMQLYRQGHQT